PTCVSLHLDYSCSFVSWITFSTTTAVISHGFVAPKAGHHARVSRIESKGRTSGSFARNPAFL
ncbi:MAG: hypothetical protein ACREX9_05170, partial [Gammaproteobacteria bacterium]